MTIRSLALFFGTGMLACMSFGARGAETLIPECVGRMFVSLPGEADVAGYSYVRLADELKLAGSQRQYQFADGEEAGLSDIHYGGLVYVTNLLTSDEIKKLAAQLQKRVETNGTAAKKIRASDSTLATFKNEKVPDGFAWNVAQYHSVFRQMQGHAFFWHAGGERAAMSDNQRASEKIVAGLALRKANAVPPGPGVCLPHAFIKDAGDVWRNVGMTFRLKSHPDITVWLEDASATDTDAPAPQAPLASMANEFWVQYQAIGEKIESIWKAPAAHDVTLAEQKGLATFVRIQRPDNSMDFGYMAIARGDSKATQDTPRLRLYVIRNAAKARKKGIEPIAEAEFLAMAEAIAGGVKHR
jgi:hypothetical protein